MSDDNKEIKFYPHLFHGDEDIIKHIMSSIVWSCTDPETGESFSLGLLECVPVVLTPEEKRRLDERFNTGFDSDTTET